MNEAVMDKGREGDCSSGGTENGTEWNGMGEDTTCA